MRERSRFSQVETELSVVVGFTDIEEGKATYFPSLGEGAVYTISFIQPYFIHVTQAASSIPGLEMDTGEDMNSWPSLIGESHTGSDLRWQYGLQPESPEQKQQRWHGCSRGLVMAPDAPGGATWGRKELVKGGSHLGGPHKG